MHLLTEVVPKKHQKVQQKCRKKSHVSKRAFVVMTVMTVMVMIMIMMVMMMMMMMMIMMMV